MGGPEVEHLIGLLAKLPGMGPRSARRAALRMLQQPEGRMLPLAAALAEAHATGWGVIIKEALANGRLADRDVLAFAAVLSQPWVDVVLSGAVTLNQLERNLKSIALMREPADWPDIAESPTEYWARRSALAWQ